jgi:hypothetical protein
MTTFLYMKYFVFIGLCLQLNTGLVHTFHKTTNNFKRSLRELNVSKAMTTCLYKDNQTSTNHYLLSIKQNQMLRECTNITGSSIRNEFVVQFNYFKSDFMLNCADHGFKYTGFTLTYAQI